MFTYECKYCEHEMTGSFGDNVYCPDCDITFETDNDCDLDEEGGESLYAWLTSIEHKGQYNLPQESSDEYYLPWEPIL